MHNYGRYHPFLGAAMYTPAAVPWNVSDNPAQFHSQGGNFPVNDENRYWAGGGTLTSHSTMFHISLTQEEQGRLAMQFWRMRRPPLARGEGDQNFTCLSLTNHIVEAYVKNVLQPTRSRGHLRHAPSQDAPMNEEGDDSTSRPTGSLSFNGVGPRSLGERLAKATDVLSNTLEGLKKIMDLRNEYDDSVADYDAHMSILLEYIVSSQKTSERLLTRACLQAKLISAIERDYEPHG
jgi:hypothetical protein